MATGKDGNLVKNKRIENETPPKPHREGKLGK
jgi:hypothetical protein